MRRRRWEGSELAGVTLEALDHRVQPGLPGAQADVLHKQPDDVARQGQDNRWRLVVHGREDDCQDGGHRGRLPSVHIGVEMQGAVVPPLGKNVDPGLAFRDGEGRPVEGREALGRGSSFRDQPSSACILSSRSSIRNCLSVRASRGGSESGVASGMREVNGPCAGRSSAVGMPD